MDRAYIYEPSRKQLIQKGIIKDERKNEITKELKPEKRREEKRREDTYFSGGERF